MTRKIKALGLAFFAIAAMSMLATAGAQAGELHAENGGTATITGEQTAAGKHIFQITPAAGPSVNCSEAKFEGTVAGGQPQITTKEVTVTATYNGCQAFGQAASVRMNGCVYTITGENQPANTALVDIVCPTAGKPIEVQTAICQITVGSQTGLSHIVFSNTTGVVPPHVNANITVTGIKYELHGAVCGHAVTTPTSDGTYHGQATFKAYKDKGQAQVTEHGHQFNRHLHNSEQVGLITT